MIPEGHMFVLTLCRRELNMPVVLRSQLVGIRHSMDTMVAAIEADTVDGDVIDHSLVVDVGHVEAAEIGYRTVVVERAAAPVTAAETNAGISKTVVDTTVEAYVRTPIASVPDIKTAAPSPVAGSPQQAG